ncbi:hypothetical protein ACHAW6_013597 [Cyclotella cf. meneghiniana]
MIPLKTNKPNIEVVTSPTATSNQNGASPLAESIVSPGRVRRLAGSITPRKSNTPQSNSQNASPNTRQFFSRQSTEKASNGFVPSYVRNSDSSVASTLSGTKLQDRYGIPQSKSAVSNGSGHSRIGVQHSIHAVQSSKSTALFKSAPKTENILKAAHNYITHASTATTVKSRDSYNELPSLMTNSDSETFEDESIVDTALYKKFMEAFEITLRNNPGILPGAPSVVESIQNALYKVAQAKAAKEEQMRKQIAKVKAEHKEMESKLSEEMGNLAVKKNDLSKELEKAQQEKERTEDALKKQIDAIQAMKHDVKCRMDEATKEKEELTKHLGFLSKSRVELEAALETEMKLVEKDRDSLQKVIAERKSIQKQKAENKELESKIEIMTEAASKEKAALQAEAAELKTFEAHLQQLKQSNEITRKELEEEKRQLMEITRTLQAKKQAVIESKMEIEKSMQQEIEELEKQIEDSRMMHAKDMERLVKSKVVKFLKRGPGVEIDEELLGMDDDGMDIESVIKARVEAELKQKEVEMKQRELEMKEREIREREIREREMREQELEERKMREQELEERKMRERELEEKMMRELEIRERELEERIKKERDAWEREEQAERERLERELKEKERELKERIMREQKELAMQQERERRERELKEIELKEREMKLESMRRRRARKDVPSDDEQTVGDDSTVRSELRSRRSRSSRGRRNRSRDDDESTIASTENKKRHHNKKQQETKSSKEAELQKELDELRKELLKNKHQTSDIEELLKQRRENNGIVSSIRKIFSPQDELREEIASLREEIKISHRESPALRNSGALHYSHPEPRVHHESPGVTSYASAPPRESAQPPGYHESPGVASYSSAPPPQPHGYHQSPGVASYASAPPRESAGLGYERHRFDHERRTPRRRYDDDNDDMYLDSGPVSRTAGFSFRRGGYEDDYHDYDRESRFRTESRFSSPGPPTRHRSPGQRFSTNGILKSKYYL